MFEKPFKHDKRMIPARFFASLTIFAALIAGNLEDLKRLATALISGNFQQALGATAGILLLLLLAVAFNGISAVLLWRRQEFFLHDDVFEVRDTKLIKRLMRIRLADISNVQLKEPLGCRLLGLAQVCINTNTRSTAASTDVTVYLDKKRAAALRQALQERPQTGAVKEDLPDAPPAEPVWEKHYSTAELARHWIMSLSWSSVLLVGLALAWGLLFALITLVIGEDLNWLPLNDIEGLAPLILLPILTGGLLFPFLRQSVRTWTRWWDFRVAKADNRLYLTHGLLTRRAFTVPPHRIHAISLEQNFIGRLLGYASVSIVNVGLEDEKEGPAAQLLLAAPLSEIFKQLDQLLPGSVWQPTLKRQPLRSIIPAAWPLLLFLALLGAGILYAFPDSWKLMALPLVLLMPLYALAVQRTPGIDWQNNRILLVEGSFDCRWHFLHEGHIQQLTTEESFLARQLGLSRMSCYILSPSALSSLFLSGYYPLSQWTPFLKEWVRWRDNRQSLLRNKPYKKMPLSSWQNEADEKGTFH